MLTTPVTCGTWASLAVSACTAVRVLACATGGPLTSTTAVRPIPEALFRMAAPRADSEDPLPPESFSRMNSGPAAAIPITISSTQAASTHRRRATQKRATVANIVSSPLVWLPTWYFMRSRLPAQPREAEDGQPES